MKDINADSMMNNNADSNAVTNSVLHGKCYCGAIAFECITDSPEVIHCHCQGCRDWTGGIAYSAVFTQTFTVVNGGVPKEFQRKGGPKKFFCGDCGTGLCNNVVFGEVRYTVSAGLLEESANMSAIFHCQMKGKVGWADTSGDGLPTFDLFPPPSTIPK